MSNLKPTLSTDFNYKLKKSIKRNLLFRNIMAVTVNSFLKSFGIILELLLLLPRSNKNLKDN